MCRRIRNFAEGLAMLAERWREWQRQWWDEGRREGLEEGLKQGLERGLERGRAEGRVEGEREVLLRQLQRRFGRVSRDVRNRIRQADSPQLLLWAERLVTANRLADVFDEDGQGDS
jgi:predicted transposase YdaD